MGEREGRRLKGRRRRRGGKIRKGKKRRSKGEKENKEQKGTELGKGVKEDIAYGASDHPHTISELAYLLRDFIGPLPTEDDLLLAEEDDRVRVAVRSPPSADLLRRL